MGKTRPLWVVIGILSALVVALAAVIIFNAEHDSATGAIAAGATAFGTSVLIALALLGAFGVLSDQPPPRE